MENLNLLQKRTNIYLQNTVCFSMLRSVAVIYLVDAFNVIISTSMVCRL